MNDQLYLWEMPSLPLLQFDSTATKLRTFLPPQFHLNLVMKLGKKGAPCGIRGIIKREKYIRIPHLQIPESLGEWNGFGKDYLPGYTGVEILSVKSDEVHARMKVQEQLTAPNGFLHAAAVVALADTTCGYATANNLPDSAKGFTTIELKTNFLGMAHEGGVSCVAKPMHIGRSTQVWDAEVKVDETGKTIALFLCTQMILGPKDERGL